MTGDFWVLRTDLMKAQCMAALEAVEANHNKPVSVQIKTYSQKRSEAQNRLSHLWYREISEQGEEYTPDQIKCRAKKHFGVPLLLADSEKFNAAWLKAIQAFPTYEEQVDELLPFFPVTSLMTTEQMSRYLTDFYRVQGQKYALTDPKVFGL
jgi:hypothetical protein